MSTPPEPSSLAIVAVSATDGDRADMLAHRLGLAQLACGSDPVDCTAARALLLVDGRSLCLQRTGRFAPGPIAVEFGSPGMRHRRQSGARELLGRAVGWRGTSALRVVDATAGLGRDAFVLADLGCEVLMCEREPLLLELLSAGLRVAADAGDPWLAGAVARMRLAPGDARELGAAALRDVDAIYLDPMFPPRRKSAAVKKEMLMLQDLLHRGESDDEADALLQWALRQEVARVVVKRPAKAPPLAALPPSHCHIGRSVRFDVYVQHRHQPA